MKRSAVLLATIFGLVAILWSFCIPVGEAPDEGAHVRYAEFIGTYHRLPGHDDIGNLNLAEGFQAPLYHFLIGTIISSLNFSISDINWIDNLSFDGTSRIGKASILNNKATRDGSSRDSIIAYHILRIPNAVFGALMVWWLWLGLVRSNVREEIALLISGLFASTAEATFMAGVVGNDMLAGAFSALAFIYFVRSEHSISNKDFIIACIILSLGILTKMTVLFLWMGFIIIYSIKKPFRYHRFLILLIVPILLSGWSIIRSLFIHERKFLIERVISLDDGVLVYVKSWFVVFVKTVYATFISAIALPGVADIYFQGWYYGLYLGILLIGFTICWRVIERRKLSIPYLALPYFIGAGILFVLSLHWFRESGETMASRLFLAYLPGIVYWGGQVIGSASLTSRKRVDRVWWKLGTICLAGVLLLVSTNWDNELLYPIVNWAQIQMPVSHYADMVSRTLGTLIIAVVILLIWQFSKFHWLENTSSVVRTNIVIVFLGFLFIVNISLLLFYVKPFYS